MKSLSTSSFSSLMNLIGSPTKPQLQVLIFLSLITLASTVIILSIPLYFQDPILTCKSIICESYHNHEKCHCQEYAIDYENSPKSMTTEFSWIYDRAYLKDLLGSIAYFSQSIGFLCFTFYKNSNKMSLIFITSFINGILMIITYFITNYLMLALIIGLYFFLINALFLLSQLLLADLAGDNQTFRCWGISILFISYGLSSIYSGLLGYLYYNWRIFFMCYVGFPIILTCVYFKNLINANIFPELHTIQIISNERFNPFKILRYPSLKSTIITGALLSSIHNINYYGSYYLLDTIMSNIYFNLILLGTLEVITNLFSGYILSNFPRKSIMTACFSITGIAYMMFIFFDKNHQTHQKSWITIISNVSLALLGKIVIDINFSTFLIHTTERLPKSIRQEGYGFINGIFKIFITLIPQFVTSMKSRNINPFVGFALLNIIAVFVMYFIPETYNKKVEDHPIEENEQFEEEFKL